MGIYPLPIWANAYVDIGICLARGGRNAELYLSSTVLIALECRPVVDSDKYVCMKLETRRTVRAQPWDPELLVRCRRAGRLPAKERLVQALLGREDQGLDVNIARRWEAMKVRRAVGCVGCFGEDALRDQGVSIRER